jgi:hypothetical protein
MAILELLAQPQNVAVIVLCLTLLGLIHKRLNTTNNFHLPPGPPKESWIFGNSIPAALYVTFLYIESLCSPGHQCLPEIRTMDPRIWSSFLITARNEHNYRRRTPSSRYRYHGTGGCSSRRPPSLHLSRRDPLGRHARPPYSRRRTLQENAQVSFSPSFHLSIPSHSSEILSPTFRIPRARVE